MLWLAMCLPLLVVLYLLLMGRRKPSLRYANLALVKAALGNRTGFRRHVPPILFLLAFAALILASARPVALVTLPADKRTIIMAMDVLGQHACRGRGSKPP